MAKEVKGQVALFVVIAVVVVGSILLIIVLRSRSPLPISSGSPSDPGSYIESCMQNQVEELMESVLPSSGFSNYQDSVNYKGTKVPYLCKNINFYEPCVNQQPLLINEVEKRLASQLTSNITSCLSTLEQELRDQNYEVTRMGTTDLTIELRKEVVVATLTTDLSISKGDVNSKFTIFTSRVRSPLYSLLTVVNEIVAQESRFCYFSNDGFTLLNSEFDIRKDVLPDATKVYGVEHRLTGKTMYAAIRGCAIPAGF